jgi:hypothetical protein
VIGRWFGPEYEFPVRGVGVLVFLIVTIIIGWLAKGIIGRSIIRSGEDLVDRMPVVRSVYSGIKQVAETFFNKKEQSFDKVVLVEFPRPGSWALGFMSTRPRANWPNGWPRSWPRHVGGLRRPHALHQRDASLRADQGPDRDGHGRRRRGQADRLGRPGLSVAERAAL